MRFHGVASAESETNAPPALVMQYPAPANSPSSVDRPRKYSANPFLARARTCLLTTRRSYPVIASIGANGTHNSPSGYVRHSKASKHFCWPSSITTPKTVANSQPQQVGRSPVYRHGGAGGVEAVLDREDEPVHYAASLSACSQAASRISSVRVNHSESNCGDTKGER